MRRGARPLPAIGGDPMTFPDAEAKALALPFLALAEQIDSVTTTANLADEPLPLTDSEPLHEALYLCLGFECEATVGDLRKLAAALPRLLSDRARMREALEQIAMQDTYMAWTGGAVPEPSHSEDGPLAKIALAALAPAGEGT